MIDVRSKVGDIRGSHDPARAATAAGDAVLRTARSLPLLAALALLALSPCAPRAQAPDTAAPAPAAAAPAAPVLDGLDISSQVDRSEIAIGDRIAYEIKVVYPAAGRIELPSVIGNLGAFEVKDYEASEPKPAGNLKIQTWRFDLSTFTVGDYTIPPQQVVYLPPGAVMPVNPEAPEPGSGPRPLIFYTQPIAIKVKRTSPETVKDIADIAPLAPVPRPVPWLAIALGTLAVLGLGYWLWSRRRRAGPAGPSAKPLLPPYEEALEALQGLNPGSLVRQNRARELAFALSGIQRRYISRRYDVDALESTTTEFLALVPKLPITGAQREGIRRFCESTDLVKFAGAGLLESEATDLVTSLRDFLQQTRPKEGEGQEAAAKSKAGGKGGPGESNGAATRPGTVGKPAGDGGAAAARITGEAPGTGRTPPPGRPAGGHPEKGGTA